jgi:hypothetical protein
MSALWVQTSELGEYADSPFAYDAAKAASNLLWSLSGRKYSGVTTVTERYICASRTYRYGVAKSTYSAELIGGKIFNIPSATFDYFEDMTTDGLSPAARLRLRARPVINVQAIRNRSGQIIDPSLYYLVDHSTIQSVRGAPWTPCDVEVTYSYGVEPPVFGKQAARILAIEFVKLWSGEDCALPQRVTSVSRQGVSYTILDSQDFIDDLRTGIYSIDLFLKSVNPDRARARARVFSPDVARARRYTPKPLKLGATDFDIVVRGEAGGQSSATLEWLNAEFLIDGSGWVPTATIYNYSNSKSLVLDQNAITFTELDTVLRLEVSYQEALSVLGLVDSGTIELYATRPSLGDPNATETVFIGSWNLSIAMGTSAIPVYTIGS